MAVCRVLKQTVMWNAGDEIEAFGEILNALVKEGVVEVLVPDQEVKTEEPIEEVKPRKVSRKKGV